MAKNEMPVTQAIRFLKEKKIEYVPHLYEYEEKGGTLQTSQMLKVDEHLVIKTLVIESDTDKFLVLMHGDKEVSLKELARCIGSKKAEPASADTASKLTGYLFGGTSPFGTRKPLKVYIESSIFDCPQIYINGGKRGFILEMNPQDLKKSLDYEEVNAAV